MRNGINVTVWISLKLPRILLVFNTMAILERKKMSLKV